MITYNKQHENDRLQQQQKLTLTKTWKNIAFMISCKNIIIMITYNKQHANDQLQQTTL
jgi:hypothetical protein